MMKNKQKGVTLVEVIVVLVILAILAAVAIPSLTGYIGKAKKIGDLADARAAYMAAQVLASEEYAINPKATAIDNLHTKLNQLVGTDKYKINKPNIEIENGKVKTFNYLGDACIVYLTHGKLVINK